MFVNTQMISKKRLAKMQALFIFFASENFEDEPTAEKFVKLLDEAREYFLSIPNMQGNGFNHVKKLFDDMTRAAVSNKDLDWKDCPITGLRAASAMGACDILPDLEFRVLLKHKHVALGSDQFGASIILLMGFIKDAGEWLGLAEVTDISVGVISVDKSGESHDN